MSLGCPAGLWSGWLPFEGSVDTFLAPPFLASHDLQSAFYRGTPGQMFWLGLLTLLSALVGRAHGHVRNPPDSGCQVDFALSLIVEEVEQDLCRGD
jgi:hypothetical protein